jgi:hypothetical protein
VNGSALLGPALGKLRDFGLGLVPGGRWGDDRFDDSVSEPKHRVREVAERADGRGRREDREGMLEGGLLTEGYEHEAEQCKERHEGFGDAASRYAEHGTDRTDPRDGLRNKRRESRIGAGAKTRPVDQLLDW